MTNFHSPAPLLVYVKVQYHGEHDVNFQSSLFATPQLDFLEVSITFLRNFFNKFDSVSIRKAVIEENIRSKLILARQTMKNRLIPVDYNHI